MQPQHDAPRAHDGRRIRLGSGAAWAVAVQLVTAIGTLLIGVLVARTLGPEGKGTLSILQQSVGVLVVLGDLGLGLAAIYYISKGEVRAGTVLGNALVTLAAVTAPAAIGLALLLTGPFSTIDVGTEYLVVGIALFATSLFLSWTSAIVTGVEGTRGAARAAITSSMLTAVLVFGVWYLGFRTPLAVLAATIIGALSGILAGLVPVRAALHPVRVSVEAFRTMVHYSLRLYAASAADLIHFRQELLLLGWLAGASAVGIYSVALSLAEIAVRLPTALGAAIQAQASRVAHETALDFSARALRLNVLLTILVVGALALVAPWLIPLLFGADFAESVVVFYLLIPRMLAIAMVYPVSSYQGARGTVYWRVSMGAVIANAIANVVLIPLLGVYGAAISSSLSNVLLFALLARHLVKDTGRGPAFFFVPTRDDIRIARDAARSYLQRRPSREG